MNTAARRVIILACCCIVGWAGVSTAVAAQDSDEPNWYQVEVIIFSFDDPDNPATETWPLQPLLRYPEQLRFLRAAAPGNTVGRSFRLYRVEDLTDGSLTDAAAFASANILTTTSSINAAAMAATGSAVEQAQDPVLEFSLPTAFTLLPPEQREFNSERRRLNRTEARQILFHQAWLQPIKNRAQSLSLHIASQLEQGDYPVLQGSLLLYVERYLHVETNLWFNTPGAYLPGDWRMPAPPPPPRPVELEVRPLQVELPADFASTYAAPEQPALSHSGVMRPGVILQAVPESTSPGQPETAMEQTLHGGRPSELDAAANPPVAMQAEPVPADYPFAHALVLQQQRRMRTGELHYLDHPRMGLLIKLTPYEFTAFTDPAASPAPPL